MAEIKWIKITTNIFDDEKILLIESMPDADSLIVIWFKLLVLAGKTNNNGVFMLSDRIAYTDEMLSTIFRRPLNTVRMALKTFESFGMVEINDGVISIPNWEKHQNIDGMDKIREQNRIRKQAQRERQKLMMNGSPEEENEEDKSRDTSRNVTQQNKKEEEDKEEDKERDKIDYQRIVELYNTICISYPKIKALSEARKKAIKARINSGYTVEDFEKLFTNAEQSSFLKGRNDRNWSATFDWMIKDSNMAKVLDGNFLDKAPRSGTVTINGKEYICKNGKYYIPGGSGIEVNPYATDDLPF